LKHEDTYELLSKRVIHPRWRTPIGATKRLVGAVVLVLSATLVLIPVPLSNVAPALVIALISLAYLEEDGILLLIAVLAAVILLVVAWDRSGRWSSAQKG
jgi:hypothetical protein